MFFYQTNDYPCYYWHFWIRFLNNMNNCTWPCKVTVMNCKTKNTINRYKRSCFIVFLQKYFKLILSIFTVLQFKYMYFVMQFSIFVFYMIKSSNDVIFVLANHRWRRGQDRHLSESAGRENSADGRNLQQGL